MKKTIYVIEDHGGDYDDAWTRTRPWAYATYEKAEGKLLARGWKKEDGWDGSAYYSNPLSNDTFDSYSNPYGARILEINYWEETQE